MKKIFEHRKDIQYFKTESGPVIKNAIPEPSAGNPTRDTENLEQSTAQLRYEGHCRMIFCDYVHVYEYL